MGLEYIFVRRANLTESELLPQFESDLRKGRKNANNLGRRTDRGQQKLVGRKFKLNQFVDHSVVPHSVECLLYIQKNADCVSFRVEPMNNFVRNSEELVLSGGSLAESLE
ncbi:hypothetical protein TNCV_2647721 [Trichonephila clavipes]|nr:hypothetical protein TNCV_2647721 [Trichonephila clavipes]